MRHLLSILLCCGLSWSLFGQVQKTVHQSFSFPDTVKLISFDISGDYIVENWPGNVVMSETRISLYNGTRGMLEYMLKNKRYELEGVVGTDSLTVRSVVMERPDIRTSEGQISELLDVRIFVPQNFIKEDDGLWIRNEETEQPQEPPKKDLKGADPGIEEGKTKHEERD